MFDHRCSLSSFPDQDRLSRWWRRQLLLLLVDDPQDLFDVSLESEVQQPVRLVKDNPPHMRDLLHRQHEKQYRGMNAVRALKD